MIRYVFADKPLAIKNASKAKPQPIGEALEKISAANGGRLEPQQIVDAAQTDRRLKPHFEWNDAKAANSYRLEQARELVRIVHIESAETDSGVARAFLSIHDKDGTSYRSIGEILRSEDLQTRVLQQAERDLLAWENRYRAIEDVCGLVRAARERLAEKRATKLPYRDQPSA